MNSQDILKALRNPMIPMANDEIREAWELLRRRSSMLTAQAVNSLSFGQRVRFQGRFGQMLEGKIIKTNQKTVTVKTDLGQEWRVSPSLLTVIP